LILPHNASLATSYDWAPLSLIWVSHLLLCLWYHVCFTIPKVKVWKKAHWSHILCRPKFPCPFTMLQT
jgi:hypothetical protein